MAFHPDIVVTEPDTARVLLIVEAKLNLVPERSEPELKRYMSKMDCPVGLLVSPQMIVIYRNWFIDYTEASIQRIGAYPAPESWAVYAGQDRAIGFEMRVQSWLDEIKENLGVREGSKEMQNELSHLLLPSLFAGEVRAAGPRSLLK